MNFHKVLDSRLGTRPTWEGQCHKTTTLQFWTAALRSNAACLHNQQNWSSSVCHIKPIETVTTPSTQQSMHIRLSTEGALQDLYSARLQHEKYSDRPSCKLCLLRPSRSCFGRKKERSWQELLGITLKGYQNGFSCRESGRRLRCWRVSSMRIGQRMRGSRLSLLAAAGEPWHLLLLSTVALRPQRRLSLLHSNPCVLHWRVS